MQVTRPEIPVWCFFFTCKYFFKISSKEIAIRILGKLRMWIIPGMTKEKELPAHLIITTIRHGFMPLHPPSRASGYHRSNIFVELKI